MKPVALPFVLFAAVLFGSSHPAVAAPTEKEAEQKVEAKRPADRIVAMYFHRTQRCPTCLRMGSYAEEAVVKGFPEQLKAGTVEFHYVDFQDKRNAELTKGYKITGPALVVVKVEKDKVVKFSSLQEIWTKSRVKKEFLKYVRGSVAACLKPESKTVRRLVPDVSVQRSK